MPRGVMISWPSLLSAVVMWIIGRARAVCQRRIESGKSVPQVRKDSITAGCLCTALLNSPNWAGSPVSETPNQTFLPRGSSRPPAAVAAQESASTRTAVSASPAARALRPELIRVLFDWVRP